MQKDINQSFKIFIFYSCGIDFLRLGFIDSFQLSMTLYTVNLKLIRS